MMKSYAVIGLGRFGTNIAFELMRQNCEVLAIDSQEELIQDIADDVTRAVCADLRDPALISALNLTACDAVVVAMGSDISTSVLITLNLKEAGCPCVISKACSEAHRRILEKIGADKVVFPEQDYGIRLARDLSQHNSYDYVELSPDYVIVKVAMPASWAGKTLLDLHARSRFGMNVLSIRPLNSDRVVVSPDPRDPLPKGGATMTVVISHESLKQLEQI